MKRPHDLIGRQSSKASKPASAAATTSTLTSTQRPISMKKTRKLWKLDKAKVAIAVVRTVLVVVVIHYVIVIKPSSQGMFQQDQTSIQEQHELVLQQKMHKREQHQHQQPRHQTEGKQDKGQQEQQQHQQQEEDQQQEKYVMRQENNRITHQSASVTDPDPTDPGADANCIFRRSSLYRSVYVYPSPGETEWETERDIILSEHGKSWKKSYRFPWTLVDEESKRLQRGPYDPQNPVSQYNTELLVRLIMTHPDSCLRTHDPEQATLFYVPYLMSAAYHLGDAPVKERNKKKAPFGLAMMDIIQNQNNSTGWEEHFGWTSKYWQRRQGSDHVIVYSEALHGLWHPKNKRGNFHFLHTQYWTHSPIMVAIGSSTSFVERYPSCARKNILLPYPNTDGKWYNGVWDEQVKNDILQIKASNNFTDDIATSTTELTFNNDEKFLLSAALNSELELMGKMGGTNSDNSASVDRNTKTEHATEDFNGHRVLAYYYKAGSHGVCKDLRRTLQNDFECSMSRHWLERVQAGREDIDITYRHAYRMSTFCPCPGGDSPSAKRMFDVILGGCIPVILSHDHVWPFSSSENPPLSERLDKSNNDDMHGDIYKLLDPTDFSIRLNSSDFVDEGSIVLTNNGKKCQDVRGNNLSGKLQKYLETIPPSEILRLRRGLKKAAQLYSYYTYRPELPDNPMVHDILPDGGTAHVLVQALAERSGGRLWPACQAEMQRLDRNEDDIRVFKC